MTVREWKTLHRDYRTTIDGIRYGMRLDPATGSTVLEPVDEDAAMCPECGAALEIVEDGIISEPMIPAFYVAGDPEVRRERRADFAACTGCEFCVEITR